MTIVPPRDQEINCRTFLSALDARSPPSLMDFPAQKMPAGLILHLLSFFLPLQWENIYHNIHFLDCYLFFSRDLESWRQIRDALSADSIGFLNFGILRLFKFKNGLISLHFDMDWTLLFSGILSCSKLKKTRFAMDWIVQGGKELTFFAFLKWMDEMSWVTCGLVTKQI